MLSRSSTGRMESFNASITKGKGNAKTEKGNQKGNGKGEKGGDQKGDQKGSGKGEKGSDQKELEKLGVWERWNKEVFRNPREYWTTVCNLPREGLNPGAIPLMIMSEEQLKNFLVPLPRMTPC